MRLGNWSVCFRFDLRFSWFEDGKDEADFVGFKDVGIYNIIKEI